MSFLNRLKPKRHKDESVLLVSLTTTHLHCIAHYPKQDPEAWTIEIPANVVDDTGRVNDVAIVKDLLNKAVQRLGKTDVSVAVIPSRFTQMNHYVLERTPDPSDEITRLAVADSKFIVREKDNNFESEPVVVLYETFEGDNDQMIHAVANMFPQRLIDLYEELFEDVGIPLAVIDTAEFALLRTLFEANLDDLDTASLLFVEETNASLIAFADGIPVFRRPLLYSREQASDALEVQRLVDDIQRSIRFIESKEGFHGLSERFLVLSTTDHLLEELGRQGSEAKDIHAVLVSDFPESVSSLDYFYLYAALLSYTDNYGEYFRDVASFDVSTSSGKGDLVQSLGRFIPVIATVAVAFVGISFGWLLWKQSSLENLAMSYEERVASIEQRLLRSREVRELEDKAERGLRAYQTIESRNYNYADFLRFITESLPNDVVLRDMELNGRVWTSRVLGKDLEAITNYLFYLARVPAISGVDYSDVEATDNGYAVSLTAVFSNQGVRR